MRKSQSRPTSQLDLVQRQSRLNLDELDITNSSRSSVDDSQHIMSPLSFLSIQDNAEHNDLKKKYEGLINFRKTLLGQISFNLKDSRPKSKQKESADESSALSDSDSPEKYGKIDFFDQSLDHVFHEEELNPNHSKSETADFFKEMYRLKGFAFLRIKKINEE